MYLLTFLQTFVTHRVICKVGKLGFKPINFVKKQYQFLNLLLIFLCRGYLAPEYATYGQVSTKLDVFSFGVLILEIISGRKNIDNNLSLVRQCLTLWVRNFT